MGLQLIAPRDKYLLKVGVVNHEAVLGHLRQVLNVFAAKPEYSMFYIGITNALDVRLSQHQRFKPQFRLMCPIYEEAGNLVQNAFDLLEHKAITEFRPGILHPLAGQPGQPSGPQLRCCNGPGGAQPKNTLYILVG